MVALLAALIAPYFIDWTNYRADFEREASAVLGRSVTVRGAASARLLPFPSVTFSDVSVGGGGSGKPAMTVETFSMDAELAPFLRGDFLIFDMRMVHPRGVVDIAGDGSVDWAIRPSGPFDASRISLEKLTITGGEIEVRHALSGSTQRFSDIDAVLSAKSLAGPWRVDGALVANGMKTTVSMQTGTVDEAGRMRLRVKAQPDAHPVNLDADGNVELIGSALSYSGQFRIAEVPAVQGRVGGPDDTEAAAATNPSETRKTDSGNRLNGLFLLDNRHLDVGEFRFETGPTDNPYTADGTASVTFGAEPRFAVEAKGAEFRFDETVPGDGAAALSLRDRIAALEAALVRLPKPGIPGTVEINLPAVVVGDTTIRDVRLSSEPTEGGWTVKSLNATLPGRTTLEADGLLRTEGDPGFSGSLILAVAQPSGFAAWISSDVDDAIRRLPAAGFSAKVDLSHRRQVFRNLELVLGNAKFRGEIDSRQPDTVRPSIFIKLDGDALDVDGMTAFASLFVSDAGRTRFAESDLDLQIKAGPVTAAGVSADTIDTALRLYSGTLEIDRLAIGGLAGASISATGKVRDFPANPSGNVDASIVAADLAPLVTLAADRFPGNAFVEALRTRMTLEPGLFADTRLDVVASAAIGDAGLTEVAASLQGNAGGTALSATLSGKGRFDALAEASLTASVSARNDDATSLLALAGLPALPLGLTGPGEATIVARGAAATGLETSISLKGDQFLSSFDGTISIGDQGLAAKGMTKVEADDIAPWLITLGIVLPGLETGLPVALSADIDYGGGLTVFGNIDGTIEENSVDGDINAEDKGGLPHLTGALVVDELSLDPFAAMAFGEDSLAPGGTPWPSVPFASKSSAPFSADLDISAATLTAGPSLAAYDASLTLHLDGEGLRVDGLKAKLFGGDLAGLFEVKNTGGNALLSGQMQVQGADLDLMLPQSGLTGTGAFSATVSGSGKSLDGLVASLSGSGTATVTGPVIANLNGDALPALLERADGVGRDIDADRTRAFAADIAGQGTFHAARAELAFTLASGVVRAPPVRLDGDKATVTADLRADINTGIVAVSGTIAYAAGDDALTGSEPALRFAVEGPPGATKRTFDSEPLAQFLTQRALEREQARVEALQAALLEKQRLRRETRYYAALQDERDRAAEAARQAEEAARLKAEEEARLKAEDEARRKAAAEAAAKAAEEARLKSEADARAAEEARRAAEFKAQEARRKTEDDAEKAAAQSLPKPDDMPQPTPRPLPPPGADAVVP